MKRTMPTWTHLALALTVPAWLMAVPAAAQHVSGGGGGGGSHASAPSGGGGSGSSGGGGGAVSSGGGAGGHASGGGGGPHGGGGGGARTSGVAVSRGGGGARSGGGYSGSSRGAAQRGPDMSGGGAANRGGASRVEGSAGARSVPRDSGRTAGSVVPEFSRPREGRPTIGTAVPRTGSAPNPGGGTIVVPGYYGGYLPWGFAGLGFGSYYGGYYDPYFGGWGDPYDAYGAAGMFVPQVPQRYDEGGLRLKIKPNGASVYVDGAYVGVVDDYDGIFQKLHLDAGTHRVEVRMPGFDTLSFDVLIEPDHTTTYRGELTKIPQ